MFIEPYFKGQRSGWIEMICGSMFSGKTEELIRRLNRAKIAEQDVIVLKPNIDQRYSKDAVVSHNSNTIESILIQDTKEIPAKAEGYEVVGIDEAQFFDENLPQICEDLALSGKRVIVAGLDKDYQGKPFGCIPNLMAVADYVTKVHAICIHCGNLATHSYRIALDRSQVLLGEQEAYEARCRKCFHMGNLLKFPKRKKISPNQKSKDLFEGE